MKIKKEFVDLILNEQKKYEFRKTEQETRYYMINNQIFKLIPGMHFNLMLYQMEINKLGNNYTLSLIDMMKTTDDYTYNYQITKEEAIFLQEYLKDAKDLYIYSWVKIEPKKLEMVD